MKRIFLVLLLTLMAGCNRADGDRLARVGRKLTDKARALVPDRTPFGAPLSLSRNSLEERVRDRFRNDRFLTTYPFEIVAEGTHVRLKGIVDDAVLKQRALEIAESTVGVDKVIDELTVLK